MNSRSKIELMRIPSTEKAKIKPSFEDGIQLKAQFKHVRTSDYASSKRLCSKELAQRNSSKFTTKSCDNIYARQLSCVDSPFKWRDATRSEEQLFPSPPSGARARLSALLKKLSPRPQRSKSTPSQWFVVEFTEPASANGEPASANCETSSANRTSALGHRADSVVSNKSLDELRRQAGSGGSLNVTQLSSSSCDLMQSLVPLPQATAAVADRPKVRLYESNKAAKLRNNRYVSGGKTGERLKVRAGASRPHTLLLPAAGGGGGGRLQRRMASYESIGSCSLDVDVTASDSASELNGSVSERTLHSLNLSTRTPDRDSIARTEHNGANAAAEIRVNGDKDVEIVKKPSYLGLACSISGYTTITNYDSKLRDGFRSRDQSPAGRLIIRSRDASPLTFDRSHLDSAANRCRSNCGNFLTAPGANDGVANRSREAPNGRTLPTARPVNSATETDGVMTTNGQESATGTLRESSRSFMSTMLATNYSSTSCEVTSSFQSSNFESPTRSAFRNGASSVNGTNGMNGSHARNGVDSLNAPDFGAPLKRSPGAVRVTEFTSHTMSSVNGDAKSTYSTTKFSESKSQFLELRPQSGEQKGTFAETRGFVTCEVANGGRACANGGDEAGSVWTGSAVSNKSFIQQRVERLYGPGALAQGFFRRTSNGHLQQPKEQAAVSPCEASPPPSKQASLPVLRHLRPEFRAQLSLGSRKAVEADSITAAKMTVPVLQPQVSVESVTDILPAAPEVVLPIEQTVVPALDSVDVKAGASETKDGAYFLKVLKDEIDIINALVARTEKDMEEREAGSLPEEAEGKVRSVVGQARLLVKQKLQQFEGLCHKNMAQSCEEQFPTTADDLAGFWDMVKLQVCQVHGLFQELDALRAANWIQDEVVLSDVVDSNTTPKRRSIAAAKRVPKSTPANEEARKAREEARRKIMEERRREMREKSKIKKEEEEAVEIFVPQENGN